MGQGKGSPALVPPRVTGSLARHRGIRLAGAIVALMAIASAAVWLLTAQQPRPVRAASIMSEVFPPGNVGAPDFALSDQTGRVVSLHTLRGKVIGLTFLNSHCTDLCPIEADQIGRMERGLSKGAPFVLVVISVAPGTDTPGSVRTFATSHGWIGEWHWLIGTRGVLAPVWSAYTVDAEPNPSADNPANVAHSGALYVIDPQGYERVGFGINFPPEVVQYDVAALSPRQGWRWPWE
jgi:protein SCO1